MARNSRAYRERAFNPNRPVYVRRPFNGSGRKWQRGDHFDWKKLAVAQRRVRQLFDAGHIMHDETEEGDASPKKESKRIDTEVGPVDVQTPDELDDISDMKELQRIAREEGARTTTSKTLQRKYIRDNRAEGGAAESAEDEEPAESYANDESEYSEE